MCVDIRALLGCFLDCSEGEWWCLWLWVPYRHCCFLIAEQGKEADSAGPADESTGLENLALTSQNHPLKVIGLVRKMRWGLTTQNLCSFVAREPTKTGTALIRILVPLTPTWNLEPQWICPEPTAPGFQLPPHYRGPQSHSLPIETTFSQLKNTWGMSSSLVNVLPFLNCEWSRRLMISSPVLAVSQPA